MKFNMFNSFHRMMYVFLILGYGHNTYAEDFLNTSDYETYSRVEGSGHERGFYFQVTLNLGEELLPKNSLLPYSNPVSEDLITKKINEFEPIIDFQTNSALCEIYQVFFSPNSLVAYGTDVTYAYLIETKNKTLPSQCNLKVYNYDKSLLLREIEFFVNSGSR